MFSLINKTTCSAFIWKVSNFSKLTNANISNFSHELEWNDLTATTFVIDFG